MEWNPPMVCGERHPLRPPNIKVSWVQCQCRGATGGPKGHRYVMCLTCRWEWREGGCDRLVDGRPVED